MKIDIEGFELDAISGMVNVLMNHRPVILVEVNKEMLEARGESPSALFALLTSLNYRIEALLKPRRGKYQVSVATKPIVSNAQQDGYYDALCLPMERIAGSKGKGLTNLAGRSSR